MEDSTKDSQSADNQQRQKPPSSSITHGLPEKASKSHYDTPVQNHPKGQPASILRNASSKFSCALPACDGNIDTAEHCRSSRKGVRFTDGSSPGHLNIPEEEHRKLPCYEPCPNAVSHTQLDLPESNWSDLLRQSSDITTLKTLLDQSSINSDTHVIVTQPNGKTNEETAD